MPTTVNEHSGNLLSIIVAGCLSILGGISAKLTGAALSRYRARRTQAEKQEAQQADERLDERRIYIDAVDRRLVDLRDELQIERAERERMRLERDKSQEAYAALMERYAQLQADNRRLRGDDGG